MCTTSGRVTTRCRGSRTMGGILYFFSSLPRPDVECRPPVALSSFPLAVGGNADVEEDPPTRRSSSLWLVVAVRIVFTRVTTRGGVSLTMGGILYFFSSSHGPEVKLLDAVAPAKFLIDTGTAEDDWVVEDEPEDTIRVVSSLIIVGRVYIFSLFDEIVLYLGPSLVDAELAEELVSDVRVISEP